MLACSPASYAQSHAVPVSNGSLVLDLAPGAIVMYSMKRERPPPWLGRRACAHASRAPIGAGYLRLRDAHFYCTVCIRMSPLSLRRKGFRALISNLFLPNDSRPRRGRGASPRGVKRQPQCAGPQGQRSHPVPRREGEADERGPPSRREGPRGPASPYTLQPRR